MTRKKHITPVKRNCEAFPNFTGQHLIHNKKLIKEIVDQAKVSAQDLVLDLGAGKGALTSILSERAGKVIAVEYDKKFVDILVQKFDHCANTKVICEDILNIHLPKEPFIVVANIPYAITTPIMKKLLNSPASHFQKGVIVMEKGAAKRFASRIVKDPYVMVWRMWFDIRYVKGISRKNFAPPPGVDSALISIKRKEKPIVPLRDYLIFWGLAEYALKDPRLPVDLALRGVLTPTQIKYLKRNLEYSGSIAALSERQWGLIFETMVKHVPRFRWPRINKQNDH